MDTVTITGIIGVLGFITSIISIIYARQQTKSAKEQVRLLREESEKKKTFREPLRKFLKL
jgi:hypothetical protein